MPPDSSLPAETSRSLSLYAEYLPKLARLSVVVHLPTPSTRHNTQARIVTDDDASRLVVTHEGVVAELRLPAKTTPLGGGEEPLPLPGGPGLDKMSWGFRPADHGGAGLAGRLRAGGGVGVDADTVVVPWSAASDLVASPGSGGVVGRDVVCRRCGAVVVGRERLAVWKDLPSENWAEMMEFWHCHKPTTNGHDERTTIVGNSTPGQGDKASEEALASRGYGANSAIVAQVGVGFVDLTKMLFHSEDCRCVVVSKVVGGLAVLFPLTLFLLSALLLWSSTHLSWLISTGHQEVNRAVSVPWLSIQMPESKVVLSSLRLQYELPRNLRTLALGEADRLFQRWRAEPTRLFHDTVHRIGHTRINQSHIHICTHSIDTAWCFLY